MKRFAKNSARPYKRIYVGLFVDGKPAKGGRNPTKYYTEPFR